MQQGECPVCKTNNLRYGTIDFYDDQCYFPRRCANCMSEGEEWYQMDFISHENLYDKDGNEIKEKLDD